MLQLKVGELCRKKNFFISCSFFLPFFLLRAHVNEKKIDYIIFVQLNIVADTLPIYFLALNGSGV